MSTRVFSFGNGISEGDPKRKDLLGGKGAGIAEMTNLGLPVPPGFTISTEVGPAVAANGVDDALMREVLSAMARVETIVGAKFGDPEAPLLVSVRSGAPASMPGMMDTVLNLGLSRRTLPALTKRTNDARFAFDTYRRFLGMFGSIVLGIDRERFDGPFERLRDAAAKRAGVDTTRFNSEEIRRKFPDHKLLAADLEAACATFEEVIAEQTGKPMPDSAEEQLRAAITTVFRSWNNPRATYYRSINDVPDSPGTACTVQAMVFGNLGGTSATGVAFTRNPSTGERELYGEWLPNAQGEDVVAGIRTPQPIRGPSEGSLETSMPNVYRTLVATAENLEHHFRDMQDLEFTVQDEKFFMLQCRSGKRSGRAAVRIATDLVAENLISKDEAILRVDARSLDQLLHPTIDPDAKTVVLAKGLPASPGAASGHIVFTADEAEKKSAQGVPVILVRLETSPEDIHGMKAARGIVTARGGMTSHAAVVARGMGRPCIVGTSALAVNYAQEIVTVTVYDELNRPKETISLKKGDLVTIDGSTGSLFQGVVPTVAASLRSEFGTLMTWADAARRLSVRANADTPLDAKTARAFGAEGIGLCRTEHMFFDDKRIFSMRKMILADSVDDRERALAELLPFQREDFVGIFREMDGLPVTIRLLDPPLHEFLPTTTAQIRDLATSIGVSEERLVHKTRELHEYNPMLGHRGCRLAVTYPEIYRMQVRAILEAAIAARAEGIAVFPEIMIPLSISKPELERMKSLVSDVARDVFKDATPIAYSFGTMIELPRAALIADELATVGTFFSFGTNDLTQAVLGLSRDDAGKFLPTYVDAGLLPKDPFVSIDERGVGELVRLACERGRGANRSLKIGICGEHGGDPSSVDFFHRAALDYVSCSPFRVVIARLAAAQAALRHRNAT